MEHCQQAKKTLHSSVGAAWFFQQGDRVVLYTWEKFQPIANFQAPRLAGRSRMKQK